MPTKSVDVDLRPPQVNLEMYAGINDTVTVYRRNRTTEAVLPMAGFTNPVALWKPALGDVASVSMGAVIQADSVVVSISAAMKTAFTAPRGVWQVDVDDDTGNTVTLVRGQVTVEQEIGD